MALFDPNVRFVRPPKRPGQGRRMIISWALTVVIIALIAGAVFFGLPAWVSTVLILAVLAAMIVLSRRWR